MGSETCRNRRSPRTLVTGGDIRREILAVAPAFLDPERYHPDEAFEALLLVMHAYSLGSRTARDLMYERSRRSATWHVPSRKEALDTIAHLASIRGYLPYLIGKAA
jgi:hypothetical protein